MLIYDLEISSKEKKTCVTIKISNSETMSAEHKTQQHEHQGDECSDNSDRHWSNEYSSVV